MHSPKPLSLISSKLQLQREVLSNRHTTTLMSLRKGQRKEVLRETKKRKHKLVARVGDEEDESDNGGVLCDIVWWSKSLTMAVALAAAAWTSPGEMARSVTSWAGAAIFWWRRCHARSSSFCGFQTPTCLMPLL